LLKIIINKGNSFRKTITKTYVKMKKQILRVFFTLSIFAMAASSCTKESGNEQTNAVSEKKSDIATIEAQLGAPLVKKTKTISDDKGNSVTLLVASKNAAVVQDYLDNMDISLVVVDNFQAPAVAKTNTTISKPDEDLTSGTEGLMLEVISKSFGTDTKAFKLDFKGRSVVTQSTMRSTWEHESSLFIEGFIIQYYGPNCTLASCYDNLKVDHWTRHCALCSYKFFATNTLAPGQGWSSCNDGRRTKAVLSGNFSPSHYNYSFTFWNCA
jgi:hypothetical protein